MKFWGLVMGNLVERGNAGASINLTSNLPRLWRLQDWFGTLTRPAILGEDSKNFLLLVKQKKKKKKNRDGEKVKTTSFLLGNSAYFLTLSYTTKNMLNSPKVKTTSFLLGNSAYFLWCKTESENARLAINVTFMVVLWVDRWLVGLLLVVMGEVWRKSFIKLLQNNFNKLFLNISKCLSVYPFQI
jgi:hypothetical protein